MFYKILMVCHANICRSPAAEALLRNRFKDDPQFSIQSAGTHALPLLPAAADIIEIMAHRKNIDLCSHRSRQLTVELLAWADLVLVMEAQQQKFIENNFSATHGKVHSLGKWGNGDIPDPYLKTTAHYEAAIDLIDHCLDRWQERIWRKECER